MKHRIALLLILGLLAAGCREGDSVPGAVFPSFVYTSADSLEGYRIAQRMPEVLDKVPCYCGCGKQSQHKSLKECFLKPEDGFDDHAANCDLCLREAKDVNNWRNRGMSLKEVRQRIEQTYKQYGAPTETPPLE